MPSQPPQICRHRRFADPSFAARDSHRVKYPRQVRRLRFAGGGDTGGHGDLYLLHTWQSSDDLSGALLHLLSDRASGGRQLNGESHRAAIDLHVPDETKRDDIAMEIRI